MPRIPKTVGVRQNLRADRLTEFGELVRRRVNAEVPALFKKCKVAGQTRGMRRSQSKARLEAIWREQDAKEG